MKSDSRNRSRSGGRVARVQRGLLRHVCCAHSHISGQGGGDSVKQSGWSSPRGSSSISSNSGGFFLRKRSSVRNPFKPLQALGLQALQRLTPHQQRPAVMQHERAKLSLGLAIHGAKLGPWPEVDSRRHQRTHLLAQPLELHIVRLEPRHVLLLLLGRQVGQVHRGIGVSRHRSTVAAHWAAHPWQPPSVPVVVPARVAGLRDSHATSRSA